MEERRSSGSHTQSFITGVFAVLVVISVVLVVTVTYGCQTSNSSVLEYGFALVILQGAFWLSASDLDCIIGLFLILRALTEQVLGSSALQPVHCHFGTL